MSKFDEREKSFEKKFQMDEELKFKISARANKHLGEWAAKALGIDNKEKITAVNKLGPKASSRDST